MTTATNDIKLMNDEKGMTHLREEDVSVGENEQIPGCWVGLSPQPQGFAQSFGENRTVYTW